MQRSCEPERDSYDGDDRLGVMSDRCANCGDPVVSDEWHPVTTLRRDDGSVEIHDFCSEVCRDAWEDDGGSMDGDDVDAADDTDDVGNGDAASGADGATDAEN